MNSADTFKLTAQLYKFVMDASLGPTVVRFYTLTAVFDIFACENLANTKFVKVARRDLALNLFVLA